MLQINGSEATTQANSVNWLQMILKMLKATQIAGMSGKSRILLQKLCRNLIYLIIYL